VSAVTDGEAQSGPATAGPPSLFWVALFLVTLNWGGSEETTGTGTVPLRGSASIRRAASDP